MKGLRFPIVGTVGAGFPKASEGYEDQPIDPYDVLIPRPAATFFFRVSGDALRDGGAGVGVLGDERPPGFTVQHEQADRAAPPYPRPSCWVHPGHAAADTRRGQA